MIYINGQAVAPTQAIDTQRIKGHITDGLIYDFEFTKSPVFDEISQAEIADGYATASINLTNKQFACFDKAKTKQIDSWVFVNNLPLCCGLTEFSFSLWHYKTKAIDNTLRAIIETGLRETRQSNPALFTYTNGKLFFSAYYADITTDVVYPINEWHNIAATSDGTSVKVYYDGTLVGSGSLSVQMGSDARCVFSLGTGSNNTAQSTGKYANVLMYNRTLTDAEVLQNYNATKGYFGVN